MTPITHCRTATVDDVDVFYRESGLARDPLVVLLHGYPTSSRMYRGLIPILARRYHVIAPDYPAFGHSAVPPRDSFGYTHEHLAHVMDGLLTQLGAEPFALYMMDFGGPIGYRLMLEHQDRFIGAILQNTPIFGEPTDTPFWDDLKPYWKDDTPENRERARKLTTSEDIRYQYVSGVADPTRLDPDSWTVDSALMARPGVEDIMLDLLHDIHSNGSTVAAAQQYFSDNQHKVVIATGYNDPLFPGEVMKPPAELKDIEYHAIDSGHFALEDKSAEIGSLALDFLDRVTGK